MLMRTNVMMYVIHKIKSLYTIICRYLLLHLDNFNFYYKCKISSFILLLVVFLNGQI